MLQFRIVTIQCKSKLSHENHMQTLFYCNISLHKKISSQAIHLYGLETFKTCISSFLVLDSHATISCDSHGNISASGIESVESIFAIKADVSSKISDHDFNSCHFLLSKQKWVLSGSSWLPNLKNNMFFSSFLCDLYSGSVPWIDSFLWLYLQVKSQHSKHESHLFYYNFRNYVNSDNLTHDCSDVLIKNHIHE